MAVIQRTGYPNLSRSHFLGTDIWSTASMAAPQGPGWLGRYLDTLPLPVDPLVGWNTNRELPRTMIAAHRLGAVDSEPGALRVLEPEQRHAGSGLRAHLGDAHLVARARSTARTWRS